MNKDEKIEFINEILKNTKDMLIDNIDKIPENWTGIEIRWLLEQQLKIDTRIASFKKTTKRYKDFMNTCKIENLF
jgi:hypothetical protein